jgi:hypothetical protein
MRIHPGSTENYVILHVCKISIRSTEERVCENWEGGGGGGIWVRSALLLFFTLG